MGTKQSALEKRDHEKADKLKFKELAKDGKLSVDMQNEEDQKSAESKLSPEEKERRAMQRAIEIKYDIHTMWLENLVNKTLEDPIKKQLLSKIIDMSPIDGDSMQLKHGLLPDLYKLFFEWPKKLNKAQQQAVDKEKSVPVSKQRQLHTSNDNNQKEKKGDDLTAKKTDSMGKKTKGAVTFGAD